jgi:heme/copper-type cytochrome/quinol oxidase subunit 2
MEDTMTETQRLPQKPGDTMSIGDWLITFLLISIPLVGLVALLVWSFDEGRQPIKSTWAKATLIWYVICTIIAVFLLLIAWGMRLG